MNISKVKNWAIKHPEICSVVLGGSRAKGTAMKNSDWDFSINLSKNSSVALVQKLTKDFPFQQMGEPRVFPEIDRHFLLIGTLHKLPDGITVTLGFVNFGELQKCMKQKVHYPLVLEMMEFIKTSKTVYDPQQSIQKLKRTSVAWANALLLKDSLILAEWNADKYEKVLSSDSTAAGLVKAEAVWNVCRAVASANNIPLGSKYDTKSLKKVLNKKRHVFPKNFCELLDECMSAENATLLKMVITKTKKCLE